MANVQKTIKILQNDLISKQVSTLILDYNPQEIPLAMPVETDISKSIDDLEKERVHKQMEREVTQWYYLLLHNIVFSKVTCSVLELY